MHGCFSGLNKYLMHIKWSCIKKYVYLKVYMMFLVAFDDSDACDPSMFTDGLF